LRFPRRWLWRMLSSMMRSRVTLGRTDVSWIISPHHQRDNNRRAGDNFNSNYQLKHAAQLLVTLIMETIYSSETLVLIRSTRRRIPEESFLHTRRNWAFRIFPQKKQLASEFHQPLKIKLFNVRAYLSHLLQHYTTHLLMRFILSWKEPLFRWTLPDWGVRHAVA
jgi:hypothetical protein